MSCFDLTHAPVALGAQKYTITGSIAVVDGSAIFVFLSGFEALTPNLRNPNEEFFVALLGDLVRRLSRNTSAIFRVTTPW